MRKFDVTLLKYGYTTVEAESKEEALKKVHKVNTNNINWEEVFEPSEFSDIKEVCPYAHEQWINGERFDDICSLSNFICNRGSCATHFEDKPSDRGLRSSLPLLLDNLDEKQLEIVRETIDLILEESSCKT